MIPTVPISCIQQKFLIAFGAGQRTLHELGPEPEHTGRVFHLTANRGVQRRLAHDAAPSDLSAADLELRLDEDDELASGLEQRRKHRENECNRDEADVADG